MSVETIVHDAETIVENFLSELANGMKTVAGEVEAGAARAVAVLAKLEPVGAAVLAEAAAIMTFIDPAIAADLATARAALDNLLAVASSAVQSGADGASQVLLDLAACILNLLHTVTTAKAAAA